MLLVKVRVWLGYVTAIDALDVLLPYLVRVFVGVVIALGLAIPPFIILGNLNYAVDGRKPGLVKP